MAFTPMMLQYLEIKDKYKDFILFYRLGDFYEMFFDDAKLVSRELELTLTGRDCGEEERAPMCGVPYHSCEGYIGRLIEKGYKVAICEQTEDPASAKGLVRREVIRVVTPGTVFEDNLLTENKNNYLCSLYMDAEGAGICFCDISTGQIKATYFGKADCENGIMNELGTFSPKEVILNGSDTDFPTIWNFTRLRLNALTEARPQEDFDIAYAEKYFGKGHAKIPSYTEDTAGCLSAYKAAGALLKYVSETQMTDLSYINNIEIYGQSEYLQMDINTRRSLELTETMRSREKRGSLYWVLDKTKTAPGARMLRSWVEHPLVSVNHILDRQDAVEELYGDFMLREELAQLLSGVLDLERLLTKIVYATANAKDLVAIASTVAVIPEIKAMLQNARTEELSRIAETIDPLEDIEALISSAICDTPPFSVREGGMIRDGYHAEVDYLRRVKNGGQSIIAEIEEEERALTGIKNLKVGYNRVFGYYIEVTKSYADLVPDRYIRKQTLTGSERYITEKLKDTEATILGASDKLASLEYELLCDLRTKVGDAGERIRKSAALLAKIDVYVSLAAVAAQNGYTRPDVDLGEVLDIRDGRHPVVEQFVKDSYFVPNDAYLDLNANKLMLITGPNMAGKSTYMRQTALIIIMAQIGSFVPAKEARIGIVDKVFTRVGASDDLASGQSTFMLEMTEVAYILANATSRSFIIYDEIGRGTSTYDGMSIARAVAEYTCGKKIGAKSMFATHYHELTTLENEIPGVVNYNIAAKKKGDTITFLRKIVKGPTDDSYGIEVAKIAGLPSEVIRRARNILTEIESRPEDYGAKGGDMPAVQAITFEDIASMEAAKKIKAVNADMLTPLEALNIIYELKKLF